MSARKNFRSPNLSDCRNRPKHCLEILQFQLVFFFLLQAAPIPLPNSPEAFRATYQHTTSCMILMSTKPVFPLKKFTLQGEPFKEVDTLSMWVCLFVFQRSGYSIHVSMLFCFPEKIISIKKITQLCNCGSFTWMPHFACRVALLPKSSIFVDYASYTPKLTAQWKLHRTNHPLPFHYLTNGNELECDHMAKDTRSLV